MIAALALLASQFHEYEPVAGWRIYESRGYCDAVRAVGAGSDLMLRLDSESDYFSLSAWMDMPPDDPAQSEREVTVRFSPGPSVQLPARVGARVGSDHPTIGSMRGIGLTVASSGRTFLPWLSSARVLTIHREEDVIASVRLDRSSALVRLLRRCARRAPPPVTNQRSAAGERDPASRTYPAWQIAGGFTVDDAPPAVRRIDAAHGTVTFDLTVDVDGRPAECVVAGSSGNAMLDRETCKIALRRFRFIPAMRNGVPVPMTMRRQTTWDSPPYPSSPVETP